MILPVKSASAVVSHVKIQSHISFDLCRFLSWFRPEHFFTEEELLWIMDSYYKRLNAGFVSSPDDICWTGVLWCFYSDGTHSLQSIHYWDTFLQTWPRHTHPDLRWSWEWTHFLLNFYMCSTSWFSDLWRWAGCFDSWWIKTMVLRNHCQSLWCWWTPRDPSLQELSPARSEIHLKKDQQKQT